MKQHRQTAIAPLGLEKLPAFGRIEIASRFCSMADCLGTILQGGHPERGTDKAFRNPAPGAAAIPGSPANPGLCSSRVVGVWSPELPATSPSFCAISAPASRSSSLAALSPLATVTELRENAVFTYTQTSIKISRFCACIYGPNDWKCANPLEGKHHETHGAKGKPFSGSGCRSECKRGFLRLQPEPAPVRKVNWLSLTSVGGSLAAFCARVLTNLEIWFASFGGRSQRRLLARRGSCWCVCLHNPQDLLET
jgi:hypothetical protein